MPSGVGSRRDAVSLCFVTASRRACVDVSFIVFIALVGYLGLFPAAVREKVVRTDAQGLYIL